MNIAFPCPICQSNSNKLYDARDRLHHLPGQFQLRQCLGCRVIFTYPRLDNQQIGKYYPVNYNLGQTSEGSMPLLTEMSSRRKRNCCRAAKKKYDLINQFGGKGKLLDIGCNTGQFLYGMRLLGWKELYGLEYSRPASEYVQRSLDIKVWNCFFPDIQAMEGEQFDVINLSHSMEHFADPRAAVTSISHLLAPGGIVLITIPDPDSLDAKIFRAAWVGYEVPRHYFSYPPPVFCALMEANDFHVVGESSTDDPHGGMMLSVSFALEGTRWEKIWAKVARMFSIGVVSACFSPLYFILSYFGNLGSRTYVLKRK